MLMRGFGHVQYSAYSSMLSGLSATIKVRIFVALPNACRRMHEVVAALFGNTLVSIQIVRILQIIFKVIVVLFLSVVAINCCLYFRFLDIRNTFNAMSAGNGQTSRDEWSATSLVGGVTNAVCEKRVWSTRQREAGGLGLDPSWTLATYRRECEEMMHFRRFGAMAVDGGSLLM